MKKQRGMVLFFALIVLIIMTVIGVALAVNSGQSLRMAGAGAERIEAMSWAQGAQDKAIDVNRGATLANLSAEITEDNTALSSQSKIAPLTLGDVNCQRTPRASGANLISCKRAEVTTTATFGRKGLGQVIVVSGIEQEVLSGSGS
ncbi:pilus assembly protein PilX [Shewanella sp. JM162201]|uniref:Pilus assembly protein PilX n=1 Tax=Shewanella jiangmenensis TaxID=2837387 RepID=A0ABS5UZD3_9GAMM|nr:pilus assembly PilX N-terminal domain-containing protein [Shewanella jiangmenensis]MBT1443515.1 pilus assembly protein PilX [Shewanella jiangmenensis]